MGRPGFLAVFAGFGAIAAFSIHPLVGTPYEVSFSDAIRGITPVLASTVMPALQLLIVWSLGAAIIAGASIRLDPELGLFDAALAGVAGGLGGSYFFWQLLRPVGLLIPPLLPPSLIAGL